MSITCKFSAGAMSISSRPLSRVCIDAKSKDGGTYAIVCLNRKGEAIALILSSALSRGSAR